MTLRDILANLARSRRLNDEERFAIESVLGGAPLTSVVSRSEARPETVRRDELPPSPSPADSGLASDREPQRRTWNGRFAVPKVSALRGRGDQ